VTSFECRILLFRTQKEKEKEKENSHFGLAFCNWRG
jgi:hypothetical protein